MQQASIIEIAACHAWRDMVRAAPRAFAETFGLASREFGSTTRLLARRIAADQGGRAGSNL